MASVKTAEQNNAARRAAKARQQAVAKAAARNKDNTHFSLDAAIKSKRIFENKQRHAKEQEAILADYRKKNGETLLAKVIAQGSLSLKVDDFESDYDPSSVCVGSSGYTKWLDSCYDVINAAKGQNVVRFFWNNTWRQDERFVIGVKRN